MKFRTCTKSSLQPGQDTVPLFNTERKIFCCFSLQILDFKADCSIRSLMKSIPPHCTDLLSRYFLFTCLVGLSRYAYLFIFIFSDEKTTFFFFFHIWLIYCASNHIYTRNKFSFLQYVALQEVPSSSRKVSFVIRSFSFFSWFLFFFCMNFAVDPNISL